MKPELFIEAIKIFVEGKGTADFSGMGVIFIEDNPDTLPLSPLLSINNDLSTYRNEKEIVDFLLGISSCKDKRHDGFHVVSIKKGLLSISQYFCPPIHDCIDSTVYDVGARYRTAQYGSLCKGVISIIVVAQTGLISVARKGIMETLNNESI